MGRFLRIRLLVAVGLAITMVMVVACSAPGSGNSGGTPAIEPSGLQLFSGSGVADRQQLGLFSHNVITEMKAKIPASEWPYIRNVRILGDWNKIEYNGKGRFTWDDMDGQVNAALSLGVNSILVTLSGGVPKWAQDPGVASPGYGPPKNMSDWYDLCNAVANRYKGYIDFYQIWQEPGWDAYAPPAKDGVIYFGGLCAFQYLGVLRAGYNGIKAADPDAYVISGGMLQGLTRSASDFSTYETLLSGANQDVSMKVESNRDIVAERPMYFNYHGVWPGGTDQVGVEAPGTTWYLAEGATHSGFEEWLCIQNPGDTQANVTVTYMFPGGATQDQAVSVGPHSRYTIDVNGTVGIDKDVSARVTSSQPVVVERPMYFNYHGWCTGGSIQAGVTGLSDTWYLAEGATQPGFEEWISLMNPGTEPTTVDITYMFEGGATQKQSILMPPTSRETILVNGVVGPNKDVSAKVEASNPIIVERPMYFLYHGAWPGGHSQVGATETATNWFLAEGTTRNNENDGSFQEWISIQNPGDVSANVDFTYMFVAGGTQQESLAVPAHSRQTVLVNDVVGPNKDVSVQLDSNQPIVVERPMYFNYHNQWPGGTVQLASREAGREWYFAEGTTREGFEEWLTLQNPGAQETAATITFMFSDGTTQVKTVSLPPDSRTTVDVNQSLSMAAVCDGIAIHPYDYPEWWSWYYSYLRNMVNAHGYGNTEVVVSEIGWPHAGRDEFSVEGQRQAIGEVGVGGLFGAGCRKIWIYEDIDDPPGESWDDAYNGLFDFYGNPMPAWNEYKNWQSQLPNYGNLPGNLPW